MPHDSQLQIGTPAELARLGPISRLTLLLVEDSSFSADALRRFTSLCGMRLRRADCLAQARRHLSLYRPDLIVVDLGLPDGSGLDLIRAEGAGLRGGLGLIALSGSTEQEAAALALGAAAFWDKARLTFEEFRKDIQRLTRHSFTPAPSGALGLRAADPLALQEDLELAETWLAQPAQNRSYLVDFLAGLGRLSQDPMLTQAARRFGEGGDQATQELRRLIAHRRASRAQGAMSR